VEKILMFTLYPIAKYLTFFVILFIGITRILFEIALLQLEE